MHSLKLSMLGEAQTSTFLATTQAHKSRAFYTDVIGLKFVEDNDFAIVFDMAGAELRISKVVQFTPHPFTVLDWQVENIKDAVTDLKSKGIVFLVYEFMEQDEDSIWTVPGDGTQIAWFKDPDDNVLSISQRS